MGWFVNIRANGGCLSRSGWPIDKDYRIISCSKTNGALLRVIASFEQASGNSQVRFEQWRQMALPHLVVGRVVHEFSKPFRFSFNLGRFNKLSAFVYHSKKKDIQNLGGIGCIFSIE